MLGSFKLIFSVLLILLQMLLSMVQFIDGAAHGGGMLAGALTSMMLLAREQEGLCLRVCFHFLPERWRTFLIIRTFIFNTSGQSELFRCLLYFFYMLIH